MIEVHDVIKIYTKSDEIKVPALRGIDLKIEKNEIISIVGPSGSGKTTLLNLLAGFDSPSSGTILVDGFNLVGCPFKSLLQYRLQNISVVDQFPERNLLLDGSVYDNLQFYANLSQKKETKNNAFLAEILTKMDIEHLSNHIVKTLSGGEMTRVAIACSIAKGTPILLCDEPTGQLDSENVEKIKSLLRDISRDYSTTIIIVTHDQRFHDGVDKTCKIENGRVSSFISVKDRVIYENQKEFPLKFKSHIDSSYSVRIPDLILRAHQLKDELEFELLENGETRIFNPAGIVPQIVEIREQEQLIRELQLSPISNSAKAEKIIQLQNASKIYSRKKVYTEALKDITLSVNKGEFLFIVGPSGSGKTTFMKLLSGIEPCTSGEISVIGNKLHEMTDAQRASLRLKHFGIVTQQGNLHPFLLVRENLLLKEIINYKTIRSRKGSIGLNEEFLSQFKIIEKQNSYPNELSGGELQRANLACANVSSPEILLLDEPTANLDSDLAKMIMNELYSIHSEKHLTIIVSTHDISLIRPSYRVIKLVDGKLNQDGKLI